MSLRTRLLVSFGLVTGIMLVPSLFAVSGLAQLRDIAVDGRSGHAAAVSRLGQMQELVTDLDRLERSYVATGDPELGAMAAEREVELMRVYDEFDASPYGEFGSSLGLILEELVSQAGVVDGLVRSGRFAEATDEFEALLMLFGRARAQYRTVADSIDALAEAELARADDMSAVARTRTRLGLGVALVLALIFTGFMIDHVTTPLRRLRAAMMRVADGMLTVPEHLPDDRRDEIGDLSSSFIVMTRRLAELDRTKSEFLGMVSHELKTPINVIGAYTEILRDELDRLPDPQVKMIEALAEQAQRMARLVSRLMDLSRLEAGTYQLQLDPVVLRHFTAEVTRTFKRLAEDKGVVLEATVSDAAPDEVVMDGDIVRDEVLGNLILNAIRYTPEGGRIEVSVEGDGRDVHFVVTDSGPGVPEEHRDLIFQKHYVADRTRVVGSGLGLAIAKEMVELHDGHICLEEPTSGQGARFRVTLPVRMADHGNTEPDAAPLDTRAAATIQAVA